MTPLQTKVKNALDEARIVVLGTQILVGFQYRAFFEKGFDELMTQIQRRDRELASTLGSPTGLPF